MQTDVTECSLYSSTLPAIKKRVAIRMMTDDEFIEQHASGTLRKNKRLGFGWRSQYLVERSAFEFGYPFECLQRTRITFGDAISEGDCHPVTEAGWHIDRYIAMSVFEEDFFEPKYIIVEYANGKRKEGIGIVVRTTSAPWVPDGYIVFAIVTEYDDVAKKWLDARNPS